MAHQIETNGDQAAAAFFRDKAWHNLGTVFTEEITEYNRILELAHLAGWDVRVMPLFTRVPVIGDDGVTLTELAVPDRQAIVRDNPFTPGVIDVLGVAGGKPRPYTPIQNEESLAFGELLLDGARWETAGSLKGGRVVFASLAHEREVVIDPQGVADKTQTFLLIYTSHDGSYQLTVAITPVRVVCMNTLNWAIQGAVRSHLIRHTSGAKERMAATVTEARQVLGMTDTYMDAFEVEAQAMFEASVSDQAFGKIIAAAYPKPDPKDAAPVAVTKWQNRADQIMAAWTRDENLGIKGTAWGAVNALTDVQQWARKGKGDSAAENLAASGAGFNPMTNAWRGEVKELVKVMAKVKVPTS